MGLLASRCGIDTAIALLEKMILPISQNDLILDSKETNLLHLNDHDGNSLLHHACKVTSNDDSKTAIFMLHLFEKFNFNINCVNKLGMTPFDVLIQSISLTSAISLSSVIELVNLFINKEARLVNIIPTYLKLDLNFFDHLISANQFELVKKLIENQWPFNASRKLRNKNASSLFVLG